MTTQHTPGPWYTMGAGVYKGSPQNDDIVQIATAHFYGVPGDPMVNARLIAAAPDLLAALQEMLKYAEGFEDADHVIDARAAIARATGEA